MAEKMDRRVRKTRTQLRAGLARLMQKKSIKEITVKELVEEVDINRSTFYLHYTDIYQMLESIENELMEGITNAVRENPLDVIHKDGTYPFISRIFSLLEDNRDICNALLGPNGDMAFVIQIEKFVADTVLKQLSDMFPRNIHDIEYSYAYCLNGCVGIVKTWLAGPGNDTPQHMAELTHQLLANTMTPYLDIKEERR